MSFFDLSQNYIINADKICYAYEYKKKYLDNKKTIIVYKGNYVEKHNVCIKDL